MRRLFLLAIAIAGPASVVHADDCANAGSIKAMSDCAKMAYKKSDAKLNALYKQIRQRLDGETNTKKQLLATQRAWLAFRDAECTFSSSAVSGGSIYSTVHTECADKLTRKRISDFEAYLSCQEGDLSCPVPAE
ncbi:MAG: lysozyme inhibitor LprI family protein [Alphaproteobacteria bacterium]|nr:lysozyme inhibitor LprI family protein [Alphaproteobacteria bacterium]